MKNIVKKNSAFILIAVLLPAIGFAATATIRSTRSGIYLMGTAVPYYVYGYDLKTNNAASAVKTVTLPPTAPQLPIAGAGGKINE